MQGDGKMDGENFSSAKEIVDGCALALVHVDVAETEAV